MEQPSAAADDDGVAVHAQPERELLLEEARRREFERNGRARAMASVIELRYFAAGRSSKADSLRARRQPTTVGDFELLKVIGRGAFGEVRLCRERASRSVFAMKTMSKEKLVSMGKVAHVWAERCAMAEAAHVSPWLVQLHHAWCSAEHVYLVMDYLPGGDLMSRARRPLPLERGCAHARPTSTPAHAPTPQLGTPRSDARRAAPLPLTHEGARLRSADQARPPLGARGRLLRRRGRARD